MAYTTGKTPMKIAAVHSGNSSAADDLSKWSHKWDIIQHFYTHQQLPMVARGSYLLEKLGMASFRRRRLKRVKKKP
ncbi:hypothetical protein H5410_043023 [Solanum commersonii]|uniref:Uncharacterized protein n=1 Tax=Solanum commersonii TaxID=4109 RepID=A0A9J5XX97_SOLCO|nr:hypothetical protein H5410_043023 [Solanum commersonii]